MGALPHDTVNLPESLSPEPQIKKAAVKFTKTLLNDLKPPATGRIELQSDDYRGLKFRVTSNGHKSFSLLFRINGEQNRYTIGPWPEVSIAEAYKRADAAREQIRRGINPGVEKQQKRHAKKVARAARKVGIAAEATPGSFYAVLLEYLNWLQRYRAPRTHQEVSRLLLRETTPIWSKQMGAVTDDDALELVRRVSRRGSPVAANRLLSWLKTVFQWSIGERLLKDAAGNRILTNPLVGLPQQHEETPSDRVLTDQEIGWFWSATAMFEYPYRDLFRLLLITAQRLREVAEMRWSEVNLDTGTWTIPATRAKNHVAHEVALSPLAISILRSLPTIGAGEFVFTTTGTRPVAGFSGARRRLYAAMVKARAEALGVPAPEGALYEPAFVLHDLRRTAATGMAGMKFPPQVVDKILNHTSGTIKGVAAIYNKFQYLEERADALRAWGGRIERLVSPTAPSNVRSIHDRVSA